MSAGADTAAVEPLGPATIDQLAAGERLGAAGFIVTIYGDVVEPRGGLLWMGSLIEICARVAISESLVRTAVSRLVAAGRLEGTREGRRSYYRLTEAAGREFAAAAARIFAPAPPPADWRFLLGEEATPELLARGFAAIAPGVLLGPDDGGPVPGIAFRADWRQDRDGLRALAAEHWRLDERAAALAAFVARFEPLVSALAAAPPEPEAALLARLLLVHAWRGIALDDPRLPPEALPEAWPEPAARRLFARLYIGLSAAADSHLHAAFTRLDGQFPMETTATRRRLEGLACI